MTDVEPATGNIDEAKLRVSRPKTHAVGAPGVLHAMQIALEQMGPLRTAETLIRVNQTTGFDCMGCAWPDPNHRHTAEFCENGAKAVAEEATSRRVPPPFFAAHSVAELAGWDDFALGQQGRLTEPMLLEAGEEYYRPVSWDTAFGIIAEELAAGAPDEAVFYTSGRTSNEAAFLYQLFVRGLGTNNLPDCSNMCHESSGAALTETIGIGKGSVSLVDVETAHLILIAGQNPGTNHPRMLSALEIAKRNGATIVAINPLREAGLLHFDNPQTVKGLIGGGTDLADHFLQVRLGGDQALFQGLGKALAESEAAGGPGSVFDRDFIERYTEGLPAYLEQVGRVSWADIERGSGIDEARIREIAALMAASRGTVICWAMGLTQHRHAVATLRDAVSLLLLRGDIGKPGAGVCPVRGHSNVQGDRTMGIWEKMPSRFHDRLDAEFGFTSPREHGLDAVDSIRAMHEGRIRVFIGLGGNFVRATPDSAVTEAAMRNLDLTVHISTKLNRSHVVTGRRALILPTIGRTERDVQKGGRQRVTVEDSMSAVHASEGRLAPGKHLRSEVAIIAGIAERALAGRRNVPKIDWRAMTEDYRRIRTHIEHVVDGFDGFEERLGDSGGAGFVLPHGPRDARRFSTDTGRAKFTANELTFPEVPEGRLLLQTLRAHDQYNTTIYGRSDRYRGVYNGRRVVLVNGDDLADRGLEDGDFVDLVGEWADGVERRAETYRVVRYDTPRGCAAAYYPETNVLVPLGSVAEGSNTPTSKSIVIRLEKVAAPLREVASAR